MEKVFAIIVSTNPDTEQVGRALAALKDQVSGVIISDNNSDPEIKDALRKHKEKFGDFLTLHWNEKNRGVAAALNPGVRIAKEKGADWIMTLDDDSTPDPLMVKTMFDAYEALGEKEKETVGALVPNYTTATGYAFPDGEPEINDNGAITSGEIVKSIVYDKAGLYNEKLFIDGVDGEFSCRVYQSGYRVLLVPRAMLRHRLGHPTIRRFLWKTAVIPNYSPYRYYFMARNANYLYIRHFTKYVLHNNHWYELVWVFVIPRYIIKMLLFEDRKMEKLGMIWRGGWDGLLGRMDWTPARN